MHLISATPAPCASCPRVWQIRVEIVAKINADISQTNNPGK